MNAQLLEFIAVLQALIALLSQQVAMQENTQGPAVSEDTTIEVVEEPAVKPEDDEESDSEEEELDGATNQEETEDPDVDSTDENENEASGDNVISLLSDDFENGDHTDEVWTTTQEIRGEVNGATDPEDPSNSVIFAEAEASVNGSPGKADLIKKFSSLDLGDTISIEARFYIHEVTELDAIYLIDIECENCGHDQNPGPRLYVSNGHLNVDRGKIGFDKFRPDISRPLTHSTWYTIAWELTLGEGEDGRSVVYLDGEKVLDSTGTTVITPEVLAPYGITGITSSIDNFQVGLTANDTDSVGGVYFDDVVATVE